MTVPRAMGDWLDAEESTTDGEEEGDTVAVVTVGVSDAARGGALTEAGGAFGSIRMDAAVGVAAPAVTAPVRPAAVGLGGT